MTFALALAAAIMSAASIIGHVVAPKTKNTYDDKFVALIDKLTDLVGKLK